MSKFPDSVHTAYDFEESLRFGILSRSLSQDGFDKPDTLSNTCNFKADIKIDADLLDPILHASFSNIHTQYEKTSIRYMMRQKPSASVRGILDICLYENSASYVIYADDLKAAQTIEKIVLELIPKFPLSQTVKNSCTFRFHHRGPEGIESKNRELDSVPLLSLKNNYTQPVYEAVERLVSLEDPYKYGKIILHHGPPGNGKTHIIRAMAHEWVKKCGIIPEVIIDPEPLFEQSSYLMELLTLKPSYDKDPPFRFIIAEDCANLFAAGCRDSAGFTRLLNVVDGLLGSGQKLVFLFTANEEIHDIDPAILRPGRCLQHLHIPNWSKNDATRWLRAMNPKIAESQIARLGATNSLADLYAMLNGVEIFSLPKPSFGF